jgi:hypothetical protein
MTPQQRLARKKAAKASPGGRAPRDHYGDDNVLYDNPNPDVVIVPSFNNRPKYYVTPYGASPEPRYPIQATKRATAGKKAIRGD